MKSIKQFCKDHKTKIIVTTCLVAGAVIGAVVANKIGSSKVVDYAGKNVISWKPEGKFVTLEKVKTILDFNEHNSSSFAIFREGVDPKAYTCILLSDDVVLPKLI
jgi:preprotein translocase subunit SecF